MTVCSFFDKHEIRGDYTNVGESKVGIMCFLECGHPLEGGVWKGAFQRCAKLDAKKQCAGLA